MDVILLQKVENLGGLGDLVSIKPGYARNFLIPTGRATIASKENIKSFEARRTELEKAAAAAVGDADTRCVVLEKLTLTLVCKAGEEGKLYGSIGANDIVQAAAEEDVLLKKQEIRLPDGPFRRLGEYEVDIHLHSDVNAKLKVNIVPED